MSITAIPSDMPVEEYIICNGLFRRRLRSVDFPASGSPSKIILAIFLCLLIMSICFYYVTMYFQLIFLTVISIYTSTSK